MRAYRPLLWCSRREHSLGHVTFTDSPTQDQKEDREPRRRMSLFLFIDLVFVPLIVCEHILAHPLPQREWPLQLTPTISGETAAWVLEELLQPQSQVGLQQQQSLATTHSLLWFAPKLVPLSDLNSGTGALQTPALVNILCLFPENPGGPGELRP